MKTATINNRFVVLSTSTSQQRGAWGYQRKSAASLAHSHRRDTAQTAKNALSFREILERELKVRVSGKPNGASANRASDPETTQFLSGYWA
ncbi:MAG: hypothetical protein LDLANPLL_00492 [Turneriella sp.]|nr:hypothetical protein [Turneriella sp.]